MLQLLHVSAVRDDAATGLELADLLQSLQKELQAARDELAQRRREYELFTGRISHDVQGVLQNIEGFASALQARAAARLDDKDRHYLARIRANALKGNALINALVQHHTLATVPLEMEPVDLAAVLGRARQRAELDHSLPALDLRVSGEPGPMHGDAALLEHALFALLSNAVKFTGDTDARRIEVSWAWRDRCCEITVSDNGAGFDPAEAHRLFQPFARLHSAERFAGNGMGLAIVQRIAERHGGSVRAEGAPGQGASFTLALPAAPENGGAPGPARPRPVRGDAAGLRVLLVDDDALVLSSVGGMIRHAGHHVTTAAGGHQGLVAFEHALRHVAFDVVVTDWGMPQVGGERVAQAVKKISPSTAVVVLTGLPPDRVRGELEHVDVVMTKPVRLAQLRAALGALARPRL